MNSLPERIMEYGKARPEATPIQADDLLHLGDRAAVARALSRLTRSDRLLRICRWHGWAAPALPKAGRVEWDAGRQIAFTCPLPKPWPRPQGLGILSA